MKNFIIKILIFSSPVLIVLSLTNYIGDAANLFDREYEKKVASIILKGQYATNISNLDERLLQEELISNLMYNPDVAVIGSSRTMLINQNYYQGQKFFNSSVSGADIEDLIALYQLYKEKKILPNKFLIGLDPWTFQENRDQQRWKSIAQYYYRFHNEENPESVFAYDQLISLSYFQNSLENIPKVIMGNKEPIAIKSLNNFTNTILNDGSLNYGKEFREASVNEVEKRAQAFTAGRMIYRYKNYNSISIKKWSDFEKLIEDVKENDITVEFILVPFHPFVYEKLNNDYPIVRNIEERIKQFASSNNINIKGSFDPNIIRSLKDDFYDEKHLNEKGVAKLLSNSNL